MRSFLLAPRKKDKYPGKTDNEAGVFIVNGYSYFKQINLSVKLKIQSQIWNKVSIFPQERLEISLLLRPLQWVHTRKRAGAVQVLPRYCAGTLLIKILCALHNKISLHTSTYLEISSIPLLRMQCSGKIQIPYNALALCYTLKMSQTGRIVSEKRREKNKKNRLNQKRKSRPKKKRWRTPFLMHRLCHTLSKKKSRYNLHKNKEYSLLFSKALLILYSQSVQFFLQKKAERIEGYKKRYVLSLN